MKGTGSMSKIDVKGWPHPVEAGRRSVLDAALEAGVPYPHSCASGECGSCKSELLSGELERLSCSKEALNEDEVAAGLFLACRSRPLGDVRVRWLAAEAALPVTRLPAEVVSVARLSHDVVHLRLRLPEGRRFAFRAGQSAMLHIDDLPGRHYSMACPPDADTLGFHVREIPGGLVSSVIGHRLRSGDLLSLTGPHGDAWWRKKEDADHVVLVGGGTGLAPMLSVLMAALGDGVPGGRLHVYHGARTREDLYADERLTSLAAEHGFNYQAVLSHEQADDDMRFRQGMVHEALAQDFDSMLLTQVYAGGPPPMVDAVRALARSRGVPPDAFYADPFFAARPPVQPRKSWWARLTGTV